MKATGDALSLYEPSVGVQATLSSRKGLLPESSQDMLCNANIVTLDHIKSTTVGS